MAVAEMQSVELRRSRLCSGKDKYRLFYTEKFEKEKEKLRVTLVF
jgi:hypothetical protein